MTAKKNPRRDFTQIAFDVFQKSVGESAEIVHAETTEALATRKAKSKAGIAGGLARRNALTPEERTNLARVAATARWKKTV